MTAKLAMEKAVRMRWDASPAPGMLLYIQFFSFAPSKYALPAPRAPLLESWQVSVWRSAPPRQGPQIHPPLCAKRSTHSYSISRAHMSRKNLMTQESIHLKSEAAGSAAGSVWQLYCRLCQRQLKVAPTFHLTYPPADPVSSKPSSPLSRYEEMGYRDLCNIRTSLISSLKFI